MSIAIWKEKAKKIAESRCRITDEDYRIMSAELLCRDYLYREKEIFSEIFAKNNEEFYLVLTSFLEEPTLIGQRCVFKRIIEKVIQYYKTEIDNLIAKAEEEFKRACQNQNPNDEYNPDENN
jgi:hypothetical protein